MNKYDKVVLPNLGKIADYIKQGLTDKQIAQKLGVAYSTLRDYIKKYPALSAVFLKEKRARDIAVEESLYQKAQGKYVTVVKQTKLRRVEYNQDTGKKIKEYDELVPYEEQEYIPPDTAACIFLLINAMKDKYSNNPHRFALDEKKYKLAKKKAEQESFD